MARKRELRDDLLALGSAEKDRFLDVEKKKKITMPVVGEGKAEFSE